MRRITQSVLVIGLFSVMRPGPALAQPWDLYTDRISGEVCDLVNADNAELVVYSSTGELVIVSDEFAGGDLFLGDSLVDGEANVFFGGLPFGVIAFATDGDGFRSLWWLSDQGTVIAIDPDTLIPFDSFVGPEDFLGVPCGACPFWDHPEDCVDSDGDGIPDGLDICPDTPLNSAVDDDGCACFEMDSDGDGLDDCDDLCPGTLPDEIPDIDGCSCEDRGDCDCFFDSDLDGVADCDDQCPASPANSEVDSDGCAVVVVVTPPPVNIACGSTSALMLGLTFTGLFMMRFAGRNR